MSVGERLSDFSLVNLKKSVVLIIYATSRGVASAPCFPPRSTFRFSAPLRVFCALERRLSGACSGSWCERWNSSVRQGSNAAIRRVLLAQRPCSVRGPRPDRLCAPALPATTTPGDKQATAARLGCAASRRALSRCALCTVRPSADPVGSDDTDDTVGGRCRTRTPLIRTLMMPRKRGAGWKRLDWGPEHKRIEAHLNCSQSMC